jgi:hypothetical protein
MLAADPFLDASYFPGDLLRTLVGVSSDFGRAYPAMASRAAQITGVALERTDIPESVEDLRSELERFVAEHGEI